LGYSWRGKKKCKSVREEQGEVKRLLIAPNQIFVMPNLLFQAQRRGINFHLPFGLSILTKSLRFWHDFSAGFEAADISYDSSFFFLLSQFRSRRADKTRILLAFEREIFCSDQTLTPRI
jgi:hypothetical protein